MHQYTKLRDRISLEKLDWSWLSRREEAISLLEQNRDEINWYRLSLFLLYSCINLYISNSSLSLDDCPVAIYFTSCVGHDV